jgi:Ca2+-binding RTX toxin-like protein
MESLEQRQVMAANVTAALNADGLLEIEGTPRDDVIVVNQVSGQISVSGIRGSFPVSRVKAIAVVGLEGNDEIRLNSEARVTRFQAPTNPFFSLPGMLSNEPVRVPVIVDGGAGNDTIVGGAAADILLGGTGNDRIDGNSGDDLIHGGAGDDAISGRSGNDRIYASEGNDSVSAGSGDDAVYGGDGNDTVHGEDGNDFIAGEKGNDSLWGGTGNDAIQAGDGNDAAYGEDGNDSIWGGNGDDTLNGGLGDDYLSAEQGRDQVFGELGHDILTGGEGDDWLYGGDGDDQLLGNEGNDYQNGNSGNDVMHGGAGADSLFGSDGDDQLHGGSGSDALYGQAGRDRFFDNYFTTREDCNLWRENWNGVSFDDFLMVAVASRINLPPTAVPAPVSPQVQQAMGYIIPAPVSDAFTNEYVGRDIDQMLNLMQNSPGISLQEIQAHAMRDAAWNAGGGTGVGFLAPRSLQILGPGN